ncbi:hypothetical protein BGZ76_002284 [Entomortierella beljakovae]|nr:hypothetical protein BGZ76_002284 [Entomortierella beljakovae]
MQTTPKPKLNDDQIKVVYAIIDTFIPEMTGKELEDFVSANSNGTNNEALRAFGKSGIINENLGDVVIAKLHALPPEKIKELGMVFKLLSTRSGTLALGGPCKDFTSLTRKQRTRIVLSWSNSKMTMLRVLSKALLSLAAMTYYSNLNQVVYKALEYPGPDPDMHSEKFTTKEFPVYEFLEVPPQGLEISVDVVVVGSGAGGGVIAAELSKAGKRVLVVEKGHYYHQSELTLLPQNVREEWSKQGLPHFTSSDYQQSIDTIIERLGISDKYLTHNKSNSHLLEGCRKLGYPTSNIPQNTGHQEHSCGWCTFGCRYGEKQGTLMTFLKDAKENGAQFMQDTFIEKVLISKGKAVGVVGHQNGRKVTIKADKVVVSAGSIHSPSLLQRSGLKNKKIGQNLRLHPACWVFGKFDEKIESYKGSIMTAYSTVCKDVDGNGYGAVIEVPTLHPLFYSTFGKWSSAADYKAYMMDLNYIVPLITVVRDRDGGSISTGPDGLPRINYTISKHDLASLKESTEHCIRILVAAGAKSIRTSQDKLGVFKVNPELGQNDPELTKFIRKCKKINFTSGNASVGSAHQMGSCRMGKSPETSVVNPTGETWEVKDLYVADASTFPTSSGVNPMLTTLSISHSIAQFIKKTYNVDKNMEEK